MKLASRPVKPPKFPAARAVQGAAPPPPGGGAAPPHPKSATLTATIMHAWFGPPVDVPGAGLCPRCAYVASLRVEALHQCDRSSPLFRKIVTGRRSVPANAFFRGTAIVVLDEGLHVLGYTWLITSHNQVSDKRAHRRWTVATGATDAFPPSWGHAVYDVRLINVDGRIFATYVCHGCNFGLLLVHLTGEATADGGLRRLRAWRSQRFMSNVKWARGRNQAVFSARRSPVSPTEIFVQPWLSLIASFGVPRFFLLNVSCYKHPVFQWQQAHHCAPQHLYVYAQRKGLAPSD